MSWSCAEISALASKAAYGAGAPAHQSARFGQVVAIHLSAGRSQDLLYAALEALPAGPIVTYVVSLDKALEACSLAKPVILDVAPGNALLDSYIEALPFETAVSEDGRGLRLTLDFVRPRPPRSPSRIIDCGALVAYMKKLAAVTLVPDTAVSRSAGAGAGLTDND